MSGATVGDDDSRRVCNWDLCVFLAMTWEADGATGSGKTPALSKAMKEGDPRVGSEQLIPTAIRALSHTAGSQQTVSPL